MLDVYMGFHNAYLIDMIYSYDVYIVAELWMAASKVCSVSGSFPAKKSTRSLLLKNLNVFSSNFIDSRHLVIRYIHILYIRIR